MIAGVLRHSTEMEIDRQYVDSHEQSEVTFAFCRLLGFQLLPRLKPIHTQRLFRPEAGVWIPIGIKSGPVSSHRLEAHSPAEQPSGQMRDGVAPWDRAFRDSPQQRPANLPTR